MDEDEDRAMMPRGDRRGGRVCAPDTSPNPWVGCVIVPAATSRRSIGATEPPGGPHAEAAALALAGDRGPGRDGLRDPRAVLPPRPHPAVRRRPRRGRRAPGRRGIEDPDPRVARRAASTGCARPASTSRSACAPTRCGPSCAPT